MTTTKTGTCLCGAVTFEADLAEPHYHTCHCETCRRWGGPAMATTAESLRVPEDAPVKAYSSSDYGERVFCAECGTHLFWKMKGGGMIAIWIGALADASDMHFDQQIFIDSKPDHYSFSNETKNMTGAELFAAASGDS